MMRLCRLSLIPLLLLLAACGGGAPVVYKPLRYDYLPPIDLAVLAIDIEQRFVPSGVAPDIAQKSPVDPVATLRHMAEDRLKALGAKDRAVFTISDASLIKHDDVIRGSMEATVEILTDDGQHAGYAQARVSRRHTGRVEDLQKLLYDMVSDLMDAMNIELTFQIRNSLRSWLASAPTAPATPVDVAPLAAPTRR